LLGARQYAKFDEAQPLLWDDAPACAQSSCQRSPHFSCLSDLPLAQRCDYLSVWADTMLLHAMVVLDVLTISHSIVSVMIE